ncbi:RecQ family ATP-dependent DNA helicase [Nakamurella leprariae]|uniref:DNA 3'-5' helicase n=1 Tax=Nakamurella leprariae TaxID=2803911 RepID=A0A938Y8Z1_9ACTN|nr:RecQ family ATP-dependent DNA helicase [Nakamurella leprariae]MBM9468030.1 RecQ family ATP-dependent DNA helicase [Nakamurella leprariae]
MDATTVPVDAGLEQRATERLRALVGSPTAELRADQLTAVRALVEDRRRALVVQRTGWGKSAVYFVATALLREQGAGPTVIISPLLALMRNQIAAAQRAGIRAVTINSANAHEWEQVHRDIHDGAVDVLLVSPERLNHPGFRDEVLGRLAASAGLVVIDEAHCISDWGHDFRPDYRRIRTLLGELPAGIPVLATTATANARVVRDVAEQLHGDRVGTADLALGLDDEVVVLRGSLDRGSLHLGVVSLPDHASRLGWLTERLRQLDGSGIIYCLTIAVAEQVADHLRRQGLAVAAYSGRTDPTERATIEDDLLADRLRAVVATSALGMGFDKPNLRFVYHLGAPASPISYYQQVGRAGRGVAEAEAVLLPGTEDQDIWRYFGSLAFPEQSRVRRTLQALDEAERPLSVPALEPLVDLRRSRLEMMLKVLDVDGAVRRVTGGWTATGQPWEYDADRYARVAATRDAEQQAMLDYQRTDECRMAFLRRQLDDVDLPDGGGGDGWRCGRCDTCGGLTLATTVSDELIGRARTGLAVPGVPIAARGQWPSGMAALGLPWSGRLPAGEKAAAGRAVGRLDGLGWGQALREAFAPEAPDGPVAVPLRHAAVQVLDAWAALDTDDPGHLPRLDGVAIISSLRRPQLIEHLGTGLAKVLGVPVLARLVPDPDVPPADPDRGTNSAQRLRQVADRFRLETPEGAAALAEQRLLLVDDWTDTGWTLTVAARVLRRAGAAAVHPFTLAVR